MAILSWLVYLSVRSKICGVRCGIHFMLSSLCLPGANPPQTSIPLFLAWFWEPTGKMSADSCKTVPFPGVDDILVLYQIAGISTYYCQWMRHRETISGTGASPSDRMKGNWASIRNARSMLRRVRKCQQFTISPGQVRCDGVKIWQCSVSVQRHRSGGNEKARERLFQWAVPVG